jgi:hypothetical protein
MAAPTHSIGLPAHRFWPLHGETQIKEGSSAVDYQIFLDNVLIKANEALGKEDLHVQFLAHVPNEPPVTGIDPMRNLLLSLRFKDREEPIDILDLKALDEASLKPLELIVEEVIAKVHQHLTAKKTEGIIFSSSGSKFDLRKLENCVVAIDDKGYLTIYGKRIVVSSRDEHIVPIKAERMRCYTIMRLILDEEARIRIFDDYDFIRLNEKGMCIDSTVVHTFALKQIASEFREDAKDYDKVYFEVSRDRLTPSLKDKLFEKILEFSSP